MVLITLDFLGVLYTAPSTRLQEAALSPFSLGSFHCPSLKSKLGFLLQVKFVWGLEISAFEIAPRRFFYTFRGSVISTYIPQRPVPCLPYTI